MSASSNLVLRSEQDWKAYAEAPSVQGEFASALSRWREAFDAKAHRQADIYIARYLCLTGDLDAARAVLAERDVASADLATYHLMVAKLNFSGLQSPWMEAAIHSLPQLQSNSRTQDAAVAAYAHLARLGF